MAFCFAHCKGLVRISARCASPVLVAQLDKASDYESEDWGFKSLQGYLLLFLECDKIKVAEEPYAQAGPFHAWMPEWSKGADLRSAGQFVRVGSNPTPGSYLFCFFGCAICSYVPRAQVLATALVV